MWVIPWRDRKYLSVFIPETGEPEQDSSVLGDFEQTA